MKPLKGNIWKITFKLASGKTFESETDGHIGQHINFIKKEYAPIIYKSKVIEVIERWQEPRGDQ